MTDKKDHIEELWFSSVSEEELAKYDKEAAFAAFQKRVWEAEKQPKAKSRHLGWLKYAAAVAAILSVGYFSFKGGQSNVESSFGDIVITTPQGSRTQLALPDGSRVWLNAGSTISYSQGFGHTTRLVRLIGEGYFEVAHDKKLSFSVESDNMRVKVLGTKFNFRDYPADAEATVSLAEGSVAMNSQKMPADNRLLKPGQRATVDKRTGLIRVEGYEVANACQWTYGRLIFDGQPLPEIVKTLERSYNVKITIHDENLLMLRFYGDFLRQEQTLSEVLDALAATNKIRYELKGKNVTLYNP
jgi:ferric-dicitrate binding protein FerR (iron transport regulator)